MSDKLNKFYSDNTSNIPSAEMQAMRKAAKQMDAQSGTTHFSETLEADPVGFKKQIYSKWKR